MSDLMTNVTNQVALAMTGGNCAYDCPDEICDCSVREYGRDIAMMQAKVIIDIVKEAGN